MKHGEGLERWRDGTTYQGCYKDNKKDGYGEINIKQKKISYKGGWKKD